MISAALLSRIALPSADVDRLAPALDAAALRHEITSAERICHWLAQLGQESDGFTVFSENLNYSAEALVRTWPHHFTPEEAANYAHRQQAIANRAYANRMGNGDEASGDGWRYRGRGLIQNTGRAAYRRLSAELGIDLVADPDKLLDFIVSAEAAAFFWEDHGCNALADRDDITAITLQINGGTASLPRRRIRLEAARAIFTPAAIGSPLSGVHASRTAVGVPRPEAPPAARGRVPVFSPPAPPAPPPMGDRGGVETPAPVHSPTRAPALVSGGVGVATTTIAMSAAVQHVDVVRVLGIIAAVAGIALIPIIFWAALQAAAWLHVHQQAKVRSEILAILARGAAVARHGGATEPAKIAALAADYTVRAAPGLIHQIGLTPAAAPETLAKMALALLPAPRPGAPA